MGGKGDIDHQLRSPAFSGAPVYALLLSFIPQAVAIWVFSGLQLMLCSPALSPSIGHMGILGGKRCPAWVLCPPALFPSSGHMSSIRGSS